MLALLVLRKRTFSADRALSDAGSMASSSMLKIVPMRVDGVDGADLKNASPLKIGRVSWYGPMATQSRMNDVVSPKASCEFRAKLISAD